MNHHDRAAHRRSRSGYTIIETFIVMTAVTAALGISTLMIQLVLRLEADSRNHLTAAAAIERAARTLRGDAHVAGRAHIEPDTAGSGRLMIEGKISGRAIEYQTRPGRIVRLMTHAGKVVNHEEYLLGQGASAHFTVETLDDRPFIKLTIVPSPGKSVKQPAPYEILAAVARNQGRIASVGGIR